MRLLFVDTVSPKVYTRRMLEEQALGGTEATVIRVAESLSRVADVNVAQAARTEAEVDEAGPRYVPLERIREADFPSPDVVVVIRKARVVPKLRRSFPDARLVLWLHNFVKPEFAAHKIALQRANCSVVCTSRHHRDHTRRMVNRGLVGRLSKALLRQDDLPVRHIYNPIDDDLQPSTEPVDRNKMVFLSSPHKGLEQVLSMFRRVRERIPELKLHVANPGYNVGLEGQRRARALEEEQIYSLGLLPQRQAVEHVRSSLCVFYPQAVFAETFGLVYAEANAVGTPVLGHDFGAAREILCDPNPLVDCEQPEAVVRTIAEWHAGARPTVAARPEFRLARVTEDWIEFLQLTATSRDHAVGSASAGSLEL